MITPIRVRNVTAEERNALETLYHQTKDVRIRQRVQMILLAIEQSMIAREIAAIVRTNDETVRSWIKRFNAEGIKAVYLTIDCIDPRPSHPWRQCDR